MGFKRNGMCLKSQLANELPRHMPALDGLRGVAIMLVVLTHVAEGRIASLGLRPGGFPTAADAPSLPHWFGLIASGASHGVQLFFVLSAFTLTLRAGQDAGGLPGYALRRIARIVPGFWVASLLYMLLGGTGPRWLAPDGIGVADIAVALGLAGAWQGGAALAVVPGGWSVSCEAAFYTALPVLLFVVAGRTWRIAALTILAGAVTAAWTHGLMVHGLWTFARYASPASQAAVFLCGITAAMLAAQVRNPLPAVCVTALLVLLIIGMPFSPIPDWVFPQHVAFAAIGACIVGLSATRPPAWLTSRLARRVGELSYSIYLTHFALLGPSLAVSEWLAPHSDAVTVTAHFAITLAASFAVSSLTYAVIERPASRWAARMSRRLPATL